MPDLTNNMWERLILQWQNSSGAGTGRAHSKSFKLNSKEDGVVDGLVQVEQPSSINEDWEDSLAPSVKLPWSACSLQYLYTTHTAWGIRRS